jgi:DNA polymerase-4
MIGSAPESTSDSASESGDSAPESGAPMPGLCRDCLVALDDGPASGRCPACGSPRTIRHPELHDLAIAHLDCDAFYASVEKRDDPSLRDRPVIVGGGQRGVVAAACYVARLYGVRAAMPMFKALERCPDAAVIRPNMAKYATAGREARSMMQALTPLVEPLSIDEAFLDLSGTQALHGGSPAQALAGLILRIERDIGVTASIGLSYNKFLAKVASDLDKPRGFAIIGRAEARAFLAERPVETIWGVGPALAGRLHRDGILRIGHLRRYDERELQARYGAIGRRLARFAEGEDDRRVDPNAPTKSISAETTFDRNIAAPKELETALWPLAETVARRLAKSGLSGAAVTLKLKTARFRTVTRSRALPTPTQLANVLFDAVRPLLAREADGTPYRLIGIGASHLSAGEKANPPDLFDADARRKARAEKAVQAVRARLGDDAIGKGRGFGKKPIRPAQKREDG